MAENGQMLRRWILLVAGYSRRYVQEARTVAMNAAGWHVVGLGWREKSDFCCPSCGRKLCGGHSSFLLCMPGPGTPASQIHVKVACPHGSPSVSFPTLLTFVRVARWMQVTRESHWLKD